MQTCNLSPPEYKLHYTEFTASNHPYMRVNCSAESKKWLRAVAVLLQPLQSSSL
uniref:Uncharacterized protein n=1 Tax=Arundo donax TaxID=35708 RepID=A0A0A9F4H9_ARUDO